MPDGNFRRTGAVCPVLSNAMSLAGVFLTLVVLMSADAATLTRTVNSTADDQSNGCTTAPGDCTLREAIAASLDNDVVNFAPSLNGAAIGLNGTEIGITRNLTIVGPSAGVTIDAGSLSRIFYVHAGTVTLSNLTIAGGKVRGVNGVDATVYNAAQPGGDEYGGGIRNAGTLTLTNCRVTNNLVYGGKGGSGYVTNYSDSSLGRDGGAGWGGGIANLGSLTLINCTVSGNYAFGGAGGISYDVDGVPTDRSGAGGLAYGGGIFSSQSGKTLIMTGCTLSGNAAAGGPGADGGRWGFGGYGGLAYGGGLYSNAPTTTLKLCTVSDNEADGGPGGALGPYAYGYYGDDGAGGSASGGGIYTSSEFTLLSCTLGDNLARGGLAGGSLASNGSGEGGGLYGLGCTIRNTIIARNSLEGAQTSGPDVKGDQSSEGHNFIGNTGDNGDGSVSSGWVATDLKGSIGSSLDPGLDPLQDNGGLTPTRAIQSTSAAIDKGDDAVLSAPFNLETDQRGPGYRRKIGAHVDIGAFEFGAQPLRITSITHLGNGHTILQCQGVPNQVNNLEVSNDLSAGNFGPVNPSPLAADSTGAFPYDDAGSVGLPRRFYRLSIP